MAGRAPLNLEGCRRVYPGAIERARWAGRLCGYAVGVHGSQTYDLDLIAAPWVPDALQPEILADVVAWATGTWITSHDVSNPPKPHGRRCWTMFWIGQDDDLYDHLHIDLSVMPPQRL